jgi:hypothetical protein
MDRRVKALGLALTYPDEIEAWLAPGMLNQIAKIVAAPDGEEITNLLNSHPPLREWVEQVMEDPHMRPPHLQPSVVRDITRPPGDPAPVVNRYQCENGDFSWYRASVSDKVPERCPHCHGSLVFAGAVG